MKQLIKEVTKFLYFRIPQTNTHPYSIRFMCLK